jgi:ABC-2 type transport system ATP-binding protein
MIYEIADSGSTVFVTTHYMDEAEYCGRVSIMDKGRIVALGSPAELKQKYGAQAMQDVFLKVVIP